MRKVTAKEFPDLRPAKAARMARKANQIADILRGFSPESRVRVMAGVVADLEPHPIVQQTRILEVFESSELLEQLWSFQKKGWRVLSCAWRNGVIGWAAVLVRDVRV